MTDHNSSGSSTGVRIRSESSKDSMANSAEAMETFRRSEGPSDGVSTTFPMQSGHRAYYGHEPMSYAEYPERYSMGYQRMGQTITLTSHKIQFGCQGDQHSNFNDQRCAAGPLRPQYRIMPSAAKPWLDPCPERSASNSKSNNRGRTTYSDEQIAELESVFNSNPYPTSQTRQRLAYKIDVPEGKVKIWFQNRRARAKKSKLTCAGPWRTTFGDGYDERANLNNNNAKDVSGKYNNADSAIPMGAILPLPTKSSINNANYGCRMPVWRGYDGNCAASYARNSNQHACLSNRSNCFCADTAANYAKPQDFDRNASLMCREDPSSYILNGLRSPPPIRRLIYPFHTLSDSNPKSEASESLPNDKEVSRFPQRQYAKPNTYAEMQCTSAKWHSDENASSPYIQHTTAGGMRDSMAQRGGSLDNTELSECLKHESVDSMDDGQSTLGIQEQSDSLWDRRDSSDILGKAIEYTENESDRSKPFSERSSEMPTIWPSQFSNTVCPPAPESIVG